MGGLLLLTGFGIGYAAILAVIEAAAISNMVSSHVVELVQSGDYVQLIAETLSNASNGAANATNGASLPGGAEGAGAGLPNGEGDGQAPK